MAINHTWQIEQLRHKTADGVVITAAWALISRGGPGLTARSFGSVEFSPPGSNFIPYEDLSEETVLSWIKTELDTNPDYPNVSDLIAKNEAKIRLIQNPPTKSGFPWEKNEIVDLDPEA